MHEFLIYIYFNLSFDSHLPKLLNNFRSNLNSIFIFLDGFRTEYEQKIAELTEKYQDEFAKSQSAHTCIDELREQLNESRQEVTKMTESLKRYEVEILEYRKDRHGVVDERDSLMKMVERRNFEVERLEADINALKQQLQSAINSKCEALSKYDEIQHKEVNLEFKEKRLDQERVLLQNQIDMLTSDLNRNMQELQKCRGETTARTMTIEAKLHEKAEQLNITTSQIAHLTESNASLNARIEEMSQQLLAHNDEFTKMMEKYQKELTAKERLAELYKKKSEEVLDEQRDITSVVSELKATLKEATDEYGNLETKFKQMELQHQQEIEEKSKMIDEFQDELSNANQLLKVAQQENIDVSFIKLLILDLFSIFHNILDRCRKTLPSCCNHKQTHQVGQVAHRNLHALREHIGRASTREERLRAAATPILRSSPGDSGEGTDYPTHRNRSREGDRSKRRAK